MRIVSADSIFRIGKTHAICQDYAAHYTVDGMAVAHLADGCSTATSPHHADRSGSGERQVYTDFGSRLLVLAAQQSLRQTKALDPSDEEFDPSYQDVRWAARSAYRMSQGLGMSIDAISATLLSVTLRSSDLVGEVSGDGWFAARRKDGTWEVIQVDYASGAPYYLRYSLDERDYASYLATFGPKYEVRMWHRWTPGQELGESAVQSRELPESGISNSGPPFHADQFVWPLAEFDLVLAFSDGLGTFGRQVVTATSKDTEAISPDRILTAVASGIKGVRGSFLSRNLNGPMGPFRQFARDGWEHHDDLSIAGIYCNGEE